MYFCRIFVVGILLGWTFWNRASAGLLDSVRSRLPDALVEREWTVAGVRRTALLRVPRTSSGPVGVVFCWHGHGGRAYQAARSWGYGQADRTSILVFPQGLPTVSPLVDREGRMPGWQTTVGGDGDRDIQFFDTMLIDLRREHAIDVRRIYSMGHSNGGAFSYLLWQARPSILAAVGAVAGGIRGRFDGVPPLPVIHVAGKRDPLVKFSWQEQTFAAVRRVNDCNQRSQAWGRAGVLDAVVYPSGKGSPLVTALHDGGHEYAEGSSELIARFFKEHVRRDR